MAVTASGTCAAAWADFTALAAVFAAGAGATAAVAVLRPLLLGRQAELTRLTELARRRAEQVTALSHELRTPLTMIRGSAELLAEGTPGPLTEAQTRFLKVIDHQSAHVVGLCESLLLQAKIEAGLFDPRLERTDISQLARDTVSAMRPLCAQRDQRISIDTPQVTPLIRADPQLVTQALTNLLSNASRYTTAGGHIDVRVAVIDAGLCVYITDDGAGMTREQRGRLFQRFVTGRPLADGTGIGLVITKTIVELHGGSIMVDTTSARGTTMMFTLPRRSGTGTAGGHR
ncbi:sensor histidine kinase [Catellatospora citrea]|uniref:sensor histidine kinase n=1 Tax=Catellatospora citrea TaxID=53366 RepID=UPI0014770A98|nr:HAMP domain-containing sensor histidine kinase [Catellatospora citrea]